MSSAKSESDSVSDTVSVKVSDDIESSVIDSDGIENSSKSNNSDNFSDNVEHMYDYDDDEIDEISDKDPASVGTSLPHGKSRESEKIMPAKVMELEREVCAKSVELEEEEDYNIEDAMIAAQERIKRKQDDMSASVTKASNRPKLKEKNPFSMKKVIIGLVGGICILVILGVSFKFGQKSIETNEGDEEVASIKEKASDRDEDMTSTGVLITDAGTIDNEMFVVGEDEIFENQTPETGTPEALVQSGKGDTSPKVPDRVVGGN